MLLGGQVRFAIRRSATRLLCGEPFLLKRRTLRLLKSRSRRLGGECVASGALVRAGRGWGWCSSSSILLSLSRSEGGWRLILLIGPLRALLSLGVPDLRGYPIRMYGCQTSRVREVREGV